MSAVVQRPRMARIRLPRTVLETVLALAGIVVVARSLIAASGADLDRGQGHLDRAFGNRVAFGETLPRFAPIVIIAVGLAPVAARRPLQHRRARPAGDGRARRDAGRPGRSRPARPADDRPRRRRGRRLRRRHGVRARPAQGALHINEVLTTLAFNFIVIAVLAYLLNAPLQGDSANLPQSQELPDKAHLPILLSGTRAHIGVLVGVLAVLALALFERTPNGYR
ncbi:MAG: hypothetical protein R2736_07340 [Solirubrobacterales bacterium]